MTGLANDLNISQPGYVVHNGAGVFTGNTFQAGTGITLTNADGIAGNTTIASTASLTDLHVARFIVASSTLGTGANFTSIAAAIAAAQGTGINSTIFIQPGTYTENVTLVPGINLCAFDCDAFTPNVTIIGTLTLSTVGSVSISGIFFQTNSAPILLNTGNVASSINLYNCYLNCTNNTGITFNSSSATSTIGLFNCSGNITTTGIALFAHTSSGVMGISKSSFGNTGASTTANTCSAGILNIGYSSFLNPITMSSTSAGTWEHSIFVTTSQNVTAATMGGSGSQSIRWSRLASGSASAVSIGGTCSLEFCDINSTNTNAITGAGTLKVGDLTFSGSSSTINTTTITPLITTNFHTLAIQTFVATGTYTPTAGMKYCLIEVIGAGGAGGGAAGGGGNVTVGSGGGAGEYARGSFSAASVGTSQAVTLGAGGTGVSGAAGNNGGNSSVGALITCNGGTGGITGSNAAQVNVAGGLGGTGGSGGSVRTPGQAGFTGSTSLTPAILISGAGGSSLYGAGGVGVITATQTAGSAGLGNGSGGSGGISYGGTSVAGGAGKIGIIVITEFC